MVAKFKLTISLGISGSALAWSSLEPSRDLMSSSILQLSAKFEAAARYYNNIIIIMQAANS